MSDVSPPTDPALLAVDPLLGTKIGEYEVLTRLAEGGMGVVYRGVHPLIKKRVAIKVLKPIAGQAATHLAQLTAEAEAVNSIGHRNIVDIFGMGLLPDGRPYIVMEYLEGQALDAYFEEHGNALPLTEVVEILFEMCAPLAAAHKARVIHRDLKPSNVFLATQPDGTRFIKLLDFGLAKKALGLDGVTEQTSQKSVAGTPTFMAPEHAQGKAISPRTDLYALGCIGYFLLTGKLPFDGATPFDVMIAHVRAVVPRVSAVVEVPHELDDLLYWMMAKSPDDRPQSADQVRDVLRAVLEGLGAPVGVPGAVHLEGATRTSGVHTRPRTGPLSQDALQAEQLGPVPIYLPASSPPGALIAGARPRVTRATPDGGRPRITGERAAVSATPRVTGERAAVGGATAAAREAGERVDAASAARAPRRSELVVPLVLVALIIVLGVAVFFVSGDERGGANLGGGAANGGAAPRAANGAANAGAVNGGATNTGAGNVGAETGAANGGATNTGAGNVGAETGAANGVAANGGAANGGAETGAANGAANGGAAKGGAANAGAETGAANGAANAGADTGDSADLGELDDLTPLPAGTKRVEAKPAPSQKDLKARVTALEKRLKSKEDPDPAALQHLARYRVQATIAESPADRARLARQLDQWERLFLR